MNKIKKHLLFTCLVLIFSICFCSCSNQENTEKITDIQPDIDITKLTDSERFKMEYESVNSNVEVEIPENNNIIYLSKEQVKDTFETKTGILYLGHPECSWCRNIVPTLIETANANDLPLYYFNLTNITEENDPVYEYLLSITNKYNGMPETYQYMDIPDIYFLKDGEIIGNHQGTVVSHIDSEEKMTYDQMFELGQIYQNIINQMELEY